MTRSLADSVIAYWTAHSVSFLPGVTEEVLAEFEATHRVRLPADVRGFYRKTNGTRVPLSGGQDHESYDFYRLSEVEPDPDYAWALTFADYRELSWWYAMDLTNGCGFGVGAVYLLGAVGGKPLIVARTFAAFLELYLRGDSDRLRPAGAAKYHRSVLRQLR